MLLQGPGPPDYYGTVVNVAARIESVCHGGQVGVSQAVYDAVHHSLGNVVWDDLGQAGADAVPAAGPTQKRGRVSLAWLSAALILLWTSSNPPSGKQEKESRKNKLKGSHPTSGDPSPIDPLCWLQQFTMIILFLLFLSETVNLAQNFGGR